jgi:hypothetical protein
VPVSVSYGSPMAVTASTSSRPDAAPWTPYAVSQASQPDNLAEAYGPFQQPWWLDAVAPGEWDEVRVEREGKLFARLPFMIKRKFGLTALTQPPLTPFLGPWLSQASGKYAGQLTRQKELLSQLIAQLPRYDVCRIQLASELTNCLPFYWAGFTATAAYTYRVPDLSDEDALWAEMDTAERTKIRKIRSELVVRTDLGIDAVLNLQEPTFARHGWVMPDRNLYYRVDEACRARRCCQDFVVQDAKGRNHAAQYIVWDERCAYAVAGGLNHDLARDSGPQFAGRSRSSAGSLVRWESIRFAGRVTKTYDFVGSSFEPVERVFRTLGARQTICLCVSKLNRTARALSAARELALSLTGR